MNTFWAGKRVFLTGHTGFKGAWLSLWLRRLGAEVTGYALSPPSTPNLFDVLGLAATMDQVRGDVADHERLASALMGARADIVIHMAAQSLVRQSYIDPIGTYRTNVMGTVHLLDAVRRVPSVRVVLVVTTDKCYENREWVWGYRETDRLGGRDPYSNSKACAELVSSAYRDSYFPADRYEDHGVALATARAGNVIGGGDWATDRLIPDILRALASGETAEIRSPSALRPWQHVLEPLSGYLSLAERLHRQGTSFSGAWNFGPAESDARSVSWIANKLIALWSPDARWQTSVGPAPHEAHYLRLDGAKAAQQLNWQGRWTLEESLGRIVRWHKAWLEGADMLDHSLHEIAEYGAPNTSSLSMDNA